MKSLSILVLSIVTSVALPSSTYAYPEEAHRAMSLRAFDRLNIDFGAHFGVNRGYVVQDVELRRWMGDGAVQEDVPIWRALHHFFDPAHGTGLRIKASGCTEVAARADVWAVHDNYYSIAALRLLYHYALLADTPDARDIFLRELFTGMGHVVHLIQDMAQPEHTRNDQHLSSGTDTSASIYEEWSEANLAEASPGTESLPLYDYSTAPSYPTVKLPDYLSYFHTDHMLDGRRAGKGIADYSNINFLTQDTNYHDGAAWQCPGVYVPLDQCAIYDEPRLKEAARRTISGQTYSVLGEADPVSVTEDVYTSFPRDHYIPESAQDLFHTYFSSIDHETATWGCTSLYSLTDDSYMSRANFLVPRAIAYSVGIIEHMFRGSIHVTWTPLPNFPDRFNVSIKNLSAEPIGADAEVISVYIKKPEPGSSVDTQSILHASIKAYIADFAGILPGESVTIYNVQVPGVSAVAPLEGFERRTLITGSLGDEKDAVIGLVQRASGLQVHLESDPDLVRMWVSCGGGGSARSVPSDYSSQPPLHDIQLAFKPAEHCRVILQHTQAAVPGSEGTPVSLHLTVRRDGQLVEDLTAEIDGGDTAVAGCHTSSTSGHCDRFILRRHKCTYTTPPNYQCQSTSESWNWYGPYELPPPTQ